LIGQNDLNTMLRLTDEAVTAKIAEAKSKAKK